MTKRMIPAAPVGMRQYKQKTDILDRVRAATDEAIRTGLPVTLVNVLITPDVADDLLSVNKNRKIRDKKVFAYAEKMKEENWIPNGDSFKLDRKLQFIDGQHRSLAIKQSKTTQIYNIVCGLIEEAIDTIDLQARRSTGDQLDLKGYPNANALAAAIRLTLLLEQTNTVSGKVNSLKVDTQAVQKFLDDQRQRMRMVDIVETSTKIYARKRNYLSASQWAMLNYVLSIRNEQKAKEFIEKLVYQQNLNPTGRYSAIYHLKDKLDALEQREKKGNKRDKADLLTEKFKFIIKAWNIFVSEKGRIMEELSLTKTEKDSPWIMALAA